MRTYSELIKLNTFEERFEYLRTNQPIGDSIFGWERYLNQDFYTSDIWLDARDFVISRDGGYDLGIIGEEIKGIIVVHHMNNITPEDIDNLEYLTNPEYLITTRSSTHKKIHFLPENEKIQIKFIERYPNDMCPWKR